MTADAWPATGILVAVCALTIHSCSFERFFTSGLPITLPLIGLCGIYLWLRVFVG